MARGTTLWILIFGVLITGTYKSIGYLFHSSPIKQHSQLVFDVHDADLPPRLVAIADLHGDFGNALKTLELASLVKYPKSSQVRVGDVEWSGEKTILVQTGDIVDRGPTTDKIYKLMDHLGKQASSQGGQVVHLWGNHEFMNAMGDWRYVDPGDIANHGSVEKRRAVWSSNGWIGRMFLESYNVTYTHQPLGSFVHGGIAPLFASRRTDYINGVGRSMMQKLLDGLDWRAQDGSWTHEERELYDSNGPLWYRGYALDEDELAMCKNAQKAIDALGVRRLVMGHTPHLPGIVSRCNGKVLIIDTGISHAYGGTLSALEIIPGLQKDTVRALYPDHSEILQ